MTAKTLVFLGDGATWLWKLAETRFPKAVQILDYWHALEYAGAVVREAFTGDEEGSKKWLSARASEIRKSDWKGVHVVLDSVCAVAKESVESAARYFRNNLSRMDYALYLSPQF